MTAKQARTIQRIEGLMRADGVEPQLVTRDLYDELAEFAAGYDFEADCLGARDGAIIVHRDPKMDDRYPATATEHMIPDDGLVIQADGRALLQGRVAGRPVYLGTRQPPGRRGPPGET